MARPERRGKHPDLFVPIEPRAPGESLRAFNKRVGETQYDRLQILCREYEIPEGKESARGWWLAMDLAAELYPGLGVRRRPGEQPNDFLALIDFLILREARTNPEANEADIVRAVLARNDLPTDDTSVESRRRRFQEVKKKRTREAKQMRSVVERLIAPLASYADLFGNYIDEEVMAEIIVRLRRAGWPDDERDVDTIVDPVIREFMDSRRQTIVRNQGPDSTQD